ncbi:MAG: hypothetical protein AAF797_09700 [Planctomycetota bacterium]
MTLRTHKNGRILLRHRVVLLLWYPVTAYAIWQTFEQDAFYARVFGDATWRTTIWNLLIVGILLFFTYRATAHYVRLRRRAARAHQATGSLPLTSDGAS